MTSYILGILMILAVLFVVVSQRWPRIWTDLRYRDSARWPIISATVEQATFSTYHAEGHTIYEAEITYSYQVKGEYYSGRYTEQCNSESEAEELVSQYPKGSDVQIHVRPTDPGVSVLE
jgi:Protein of unknown function (DUF3592)